MPVSKTATQIPCPKALPLWISSHQYPMICFACFIYEHSFFIRIFTSSAGCVYTMMCAFPPAVFPSIRRSYRTLSRKRTVLLHIVACRQKTCMYCGINCSHSRMRPLCTYSLICLQNCSSSLFCSFSIFLSIFTIFITHLLLPFSKK